VGKRVAHVIEAPGHAAGLRFKAWDSGDLAATIRRLIDEPALWQQLSEAGPSVAEHYSVSNLADRVLRHLALRRDAEP
jgi:glycosyltransferase involved in cell wall biosynthesis